MAPLINGVNGAGSKRMHVIVIGAGLGGLAASIALARAGHCVTILEAAPELGEVGAGIQISPNVSRLLIRWDMAADIEPGKVEPSEINMRRWETGDRIGYTNLVPSFAENFGAPYWVIHRAHFHEAMHACAVRHGVQLVLDARVSQVDFEAPRVVTETGAVYDADLIIGADGVKSVTRQQMLQRLDEPQGTSFCVYRATVPISAMQREPALAELIASPKINLWVGPQRHVMSYMIAGGRTFNLVLCHTEHRPVSEWGDAVQIRREMLENYKGWDPVLVSTLALVDKAQKWPLSTVVPPSTWLHPSRKFALLGDACHGMLPFMSQGAAQAIEDAACLGRCLAADIGLSAGLELYEKLRKHRAERVQYLSDLNAKLWHYEDGPQQQARDAAMLPETQGKPFIQSANLWSDPALQCYLYDYDAELVVDRAVRSVRDKKKATITASAEDDDDGIDGNGRVVLRVGME